MTNQDAIREAAKAVPPVSVTSLTFLGLHLNDVVLILTAIYTLLQIIWFVKNKIVLPYREKKRKEKRHDKQSNRGNATGTDVPDDKSTKGKG